MTRRDVIINVLAWGIPPYSITQGYMPVNVQDPRSHWPPCFSTRWEIVEKWLESVYFNKTDLKCGLLNILCVDIAPFSGQPARHVVIYQRNGVAIEGLVAMRVFNPSLPGVDLNFVWDEQTKRIKVLSGGTLCLEIPIESLTI